MKVINKKKLLLYIVFIIILYVTGSLIVSPSSTFVHIGKVNSVPKEESIKNKTFIEEVKPSFVFINSIQDDFYVYKYSFCYLKSYGVFQIFKHRVTVANQCYYKFMISDSLKELSKINIQYNDLTTNLFNDYDGYNTKKNKEVLIIVNYCDTIVYKALYK